MGRIALLWIVGLLLLPGCANRFGQNGGFGSCLNPNCPTIIPPPATGSLNIRGNLANQNYYTPQPGTTTPAANPGWNTPGATPSGGTFNGGAMNGGAMNGGARMPVTPGSPAPNNGFPTANSNPAANWNQPGIPASSVTAWPAGQSRVISPDFATTGFNERNDPSRMPVADASQVRAPAGNYQMPNLNRFASNSMPTMPNPGYSMPNAVPRNGAGVPGNVAQGTFNGGVVQSPSSAPAVVLAEASTRNLAQDPNYQAGWRNMNAPAAGASLNR